MKRLVAVVVAILIVAGGAYYFLAVERKAGPAEGASAEQSLIVRAKYSPRAPSRA
jgi:hypothetical protein